MLEESQMSLAHKLDHLVFEFSSEYFWLNAWKIRILNSQTGIHVSWKFEFQPNQECRSKFKGRQNEADRPERGLPLIFQKHKVEPK